MKLFKAVDTSYARYIFDASFIGITRELYDTEQLAALRAKTPPGELILHLPPPVSVDDYVDFWGIDTPVLSCPDPAGLDLHDPANDGCEVVRLPLEIIDPLIADGEGDFVLSIDIADDLVTPWAVHNDASYGAPLREYLLPATIANDHRDTLRVFDCLDGKETRPDLLGK